jgi:hypothetical protein
MLPLDIRRAHRVHSGQTRHLLESGCLSAAIGCSRAADSFSNITTPISSTPFLANITVSSSRDFLGVGTALAIPFCSVSLSFGCMTMRRRAAGQGFGNRRCGCAGIRYGIAVCVCGKPRSSSVTRISARRSATPPRLRTNPADGRSAQLSE